MKSIEGLKKIKDKIILLRLDLNVPIKNGKIIDTNRIDKIIPILEYLIKNKSKIIIISHIGRPKGKIVKELSLKPVSLFIKEKIKKEIYLLKENIFELNKQKSLNVLKTGIIMLKRKIYHEEEANDEKFSKKLASFGEIY